ncbi:hypothetical protein LJC36_01260 [Desulfovibrio sp. OttesenSCG-928-C14]|nr:hypothetical protein [Desulfovibrio sp. OttesenSCG-928-C14]
MKIIEIVDEKVDFALELVLFEQWLRFYFITEKDGELYLDVPAPVYGQLEKDLPDLFPVAKALNGQIIDHQAALAALSESMLSDRARLNSGQWAEILGGVEFHINLEVMSFWVQSRESELDEQNLSFPAWKELFLAWRRSPEVEDYAARIRAEKRRAEAGEGAMETAGERPGGLN